MILGSMFLERCPKRELELMLQRGAGTRDEVNKTMDTHVPNPQNSRPPVSFEVRLHACPARLVVQRDRPTVGARANGGEWQLQVSGQR